MSIKQFDRKIRFREESVEGTYFSPGAENFYCETTEPTFTITSSTKERNPTRGSITQVPLIAPGTAATTVGSTAPSAMVEFSFSVELNGSGTAATPPRWSTLLKACGFQAADGLAASGGAAVNGNKLYKANLTAALTNGGVEGPPTFLLHKENVSTSTTGTPAYVAGQQVGRIIGDTGYDDGVYLIATGASVPPTGTSGDELIGEISGNYGELSADVVAASGVAWWTTSGIQLGATEAASPFWGGSLSMEFEAGPSTVGVSGDRLGIQASGCRGNVEFVFVAGDRVLMNFTFMGRLHSVTAAVAPHLRSTAEGRPIPPAFVGVSMGIQDSSAGASDAVSVTDLVFNSLTLNMNNELSVREDTNEISGYSPCIITGRNPQMTWNPDAVLDADYEFWSRFLVGESSRMRLTVGTDSGNMFEFRAPALQFTGISDGNRDEVQVYDTTSTLTGGDYGSSVNAPYDHDDDTTAPASARLNPKMGIDNEFVLYAL